MQGESPDPHWDTSPSSSDDGDNDDEAQDSKYNSYKKKASSSKFPRKRKRISIYEEEQRKEFWKRMRPNNHDLAPLAIPKAMIGFGVPSQNHHITHRKLPEAAIGPPFFYYENDAPAPRGVWETISRFLYDIEPEFVDSKFFCSASSKRGHIHNLPLRNRFPLLPIPPKTIREAFPSTKKWWPLWDSRTQLNSVQMCTGSAKLSEKIRMALTGYDDPPPERIKNYVLDECRKWNLVWIGLHSVAPLEPDEIEMLLSLPQNHTRGLSRTERYKSLSSSVQVDTIAYHLSVLKDMFPNGITVLSLFSGIGGALVALHRLGIHLKTVVSVESSETNRDVIRSWWEQTNQTGNLIDISEVQTLKGECLEHFIHTYGGFDLVIGGCHCNGVITSSDKYSRDGLEGQQTAAFYEYFRILDLVKCLMEKN